MEYTISEIFIILLKRMWIIVICTVFFAGGTYLVSKYIIDEEYTSSVSMYVIPNRDNPDIFASLNDLNYAQKVVNTYIVILKTNDFLDNVIEKSGLNYTIDDLKKMVAMNPVNDTEIFEIHVTSKDPKHSLILANTIARLAPQKIIGIKNADAVKAVDPAILPVRPSAPNVLFNTVIGFVLGLGGGILTAFILETTDKSIKNEEDLTTHYNVPILGMIPIIQEK